MSQIPNPGTNIADGEVHNPYSPIPTPGVPGPGETPDPSTLAAVAKAAPKLDPTSALGIAKVSTNPAEASANAYMAQAYTRATIQADVLKGLGVDFQAHYWKTASAAEQSLLTYAGYKPPAQQDVSTGGGGLWHSIIHFADNVRHAGAASLDVVKSAAIALPSRVFGAAAAPIGQAIRAGFYNAKEGDLQAAQKGQSLWSPSNILHTLDPVSIMHSWGEVANGQSSFQPDALLYVQKELGLDPQQMAFAKTMAAGVPLQQALQGLPTSERGQAFALTQDEQFQKAVQLLSDSHLSLGQMVFGGLTPAQFEQMFPKTDLAISEATALIAQAVTVAGAAATVADDPAEGISLGSGVRGALGRAILAGGAGGIVQGQLKGETPDKATAVAPFGLKINPMSGVADGVVSWYLNPLFQGLEGLKAYKSASRAAAVLEGMPAARDIPSYYRNVGEGQRFAKQFVKLVTTERPNSVLGGIDGVDRPNLYALDQYGMSTEGGAAQLVQQHWAQLQKAADATDPTTAEDAVGAMVAEGKGLTDFFMGKGAGMYRDETVMPHLTLTTKVLEDLKGIGNRAFGGRRFAADKLSPRELANEVFGENAVKDDFAQARVDLREGPVARFKRRFTNLIPTEPYIKFADPNASTALTRFAAFALPDEAIGMFRNSWGAIPEWDDGARVNVLNSLVAAVFDAAHLGDTADGQKFIDDFWERQKYSAHDGAYYADPRNPTGPKVSRAFLSTQLADAYALPNFRELLQFSKKNWLMSHIQSGVDAEGIDRFMQSYWKPAMLLRPGFAMRFAGEEILNFMLRDHGPVKWLQSLAAMTSERALDAEREGYVNYIKGNKDFGFTDEDIARINMSDARALSKALTSHIPKEALEKIRDENDLLGSIHGWNTIRWIRKGVARTIAPEFLLSAARNLAERGVYGTGFTDHIDAVTSHGGNVYFGDPIKGTRASFVKTEAGTPLRVTGSGDFKTYGADAEDSERTPAWTWALSGIARDPLAKAAMRGWAKGGTDGMVQAAEDYITGRDERLALQEAIRSTGDTGEGGVFTHELTKKAAADLQRREHWARRFAINFQTKEGTAVTDDATARQSVRDWANTVVDHVKSLTMTSEDQNPAAEEDAQLLNHPQPIQLKGPKVAKTPIRLAGVDEGRVVNEANAETAYLDVPKGHVRLFHGQNTTSATEGSGGVAPGRSWTPSFAHAKNIAGEGGDVFSIDVPTAHLEQRYGFHPTHSTTTSAHDYIQEIHDAQHPVVPPVDETPRSPIPGDAEKKLALRGGPPQAVRGTFESGDIIHANRGETIPRLLIDELSRGIVPGRDDLERVDRAFWPDQILAEEQVAKIPPGQGLKSLIDGGMRKFVGRPANALSRRPIFGYNYAVAWREAKGILAQRGIEDEDGSIAHDVAMQKAFDQTIPYIHDPATKSQFSLVVRNIMPFWFAQEQFYKRWARVFANYPEAWYKLSQTMNGLKHVGFITKDAYGQDAFVYPGSQAMLSFLTRFPFHGSLPISIGLSTEIANLNPTLTTGGAPIPAFGPVATLPMSLAGVMFPHLSGVAQAMLGPNTPQLNEGGTGWDHVIEQFTPSLVSRMIDYASNPTGADEYLQTGSPIYHSTSIMAAQYLEANGYGLTAEQEKNPRLVQQYLDRIANWTRNLLLTRALFGFLAPGTPNFQFNDKGLGTEFSSLIATMPYNEAVSAFVSAHPNATPDTIFGSTTAGVGESGTYVPATAQTGKFISENQSFFENYPQLGPWTIPAKAAQGTFNATTYQDETNLGLRSERDLGSWYDEVKYAEGANVYFPLEQAVTAAKAGTLTSSQELALVSAGFKGGDKQALEHWWAQWKGSVESGRGYLGLHPLFAQQLVEPTASNRRALIVSDLRQAIKTGSLPSGDFGTQAAAMMVGFDQVQEYYNQTAGESGYATERKDNKDAYIAWGNAYAKAHPAISAFWNGVLAKEVPG